MRRTSRVTAFVGPAQPLRLQEHPFPHLARGEALVEVLCCTLCGSDLHTFTGRRSVTCPTVLGHEILGRVAELAPEGRVCDYNGQALQVGDRVTWSVGASCGACFFCQAGLPQKCEDLFKYGHEPITDTHPLSGGLADYCHLRAGTAIFRVPDDLTDVVACPANCATATVAAAFRAGGDCRDQAVLVQGAGTLGLTASAMARQLGARDVIVCDVNPQRAARAGQFGATHTVQVNGQASGLREVIHNATSGRGADLALELSGAPAAVELGTDLIRVGGRHILVGSVFPSASVALNPEQVVRRLLRIQGVHNYAPQDLAAALEFLSKSHAQYPFAELVSARFPLSEANQAFQHAIDSGALRVAVVPG